MQRREFLQATGKIAAGSFLLNGIPVKTLALSPSFTCLEIRDRIFVMVNLFGANDTLNTVVPIQQYNIYATNRPNIKIPETGANAYINLDTTLPANQLTALHPVMTPFKTLYDAGKLTTTGAILKVMTYGILPATLPHPTLILTAAGQASFLNTAIRGC
jgi:uncharacterized protein (DUF1501 family)